MFERWFGFRPGLAHRHGPAAFLAVGLCFIVLLSGCLPDIPSPTPIPPTPTATQTPTSTATIIWFPATATFTAVPTREISPTPDMRPARGELLLEDAFTSKTGWPTGRSAMGSIAYGKGELTLAVSASKGTLVSLRKTPLFDDFYLQVDVLPSLCRSEDAYGLLLRASSPQDFYRLLFTCSGRMRLERLKGGKVLPMQDWIMSGQILPGGMMRATVGVWARGQELRVFVNDDFQFSIKDTVWSSGMLGLFARSAGDTPLTVSFSNLTVYAAGPGQPLPTQTPTATRKP